MGFASALSVLSPDYAELYYNEFTGNELESAGNAVSGAVALESADHIVGNNFVGNQV